MKLYYVVNARMPSEKAHGVQISKMAEALIEQGIDLTLVIPSRGKESKSIREYYQLRTDIPCVRISVIDLYQKGRYGFFLSSLMFMLGYSLFLTLRKIRGESFLLYSVDMDTYSYALLPLFARTYIEMHSPKRMSVANRFFFARARMVIATNTLIAHALTKTFNIPSEKLIIARNGFDSAGSVISKADARTLLSLPQDKKIALYVGRLLSWKGMEVLPKAVAELSATYECYVVGGTNAELERIAGTKVPDNLIAVGEKPFTEVATWMAAADAGIVLGTSENESSFRYTSPMKVFEYMGAHLPIVASQTPALEDVLSGKDAFFYTPDDSHSLAQVLTYTLENPSEAHTRAQAANQKVRQMSWEKRAQAVIRQLSAR